MRDIHIYTHRHTYMETEGEYLEGKGVEGTSRRQGRQDRPRATVNRALIHTSIKVLEKPIVW